MNMITFTARSRERIVALHTSLTDAVEARDMAAANAVLADLEAYTLELGQGVIALRARTRRPGAA